MTDLFEGIMTDMAAELEKLRLENSRLKEQLSLLSAKDISSLSNTKDTSACLKSYRNGHKSGYQSVRHPAWVAGSGHNLTASQIQRYSRHLLLPSFGIEAQERLTKASVLIVGVGGLGSPIALYLAASGIGCLGIMDPDCVEVHNLHRQVIHTEASVGELKVKSAARACLAINSSIKVQEYAFGLEASNALKVIPDYDVVVDASDNVATRYVVSDACIVANKPLVSGAALGMEGQITVYNYLKGPCYRCMFPVPPPQAACQRCSDAGVLGVVPGIIGTLQALEVIKILTRVGEPLSTRMLIMDAFSTRINTFKLRSKDPQCVACGEHPEITQRTLPNFDYERFTSSPLSDATPPRQQVIGKHQSITCREYKEIAESQGAHVLLDVREHNEYAIASLPSSLNVPYSRLPDELERVRTAVQVLESEGGHGLPVYVICRRGNDSQRAVQVLRDAGYASVYDISGGLQAWVQDVDPNFPAI